MPSIGLPPQRATQDVAYSSDVYAGQLLACSRQRFGTLRDARASELLQREVGELSALV